MSPQALGHELAAVVAAAGAGPAEAVLVAAGGTEWAHGDLAARFAVYSLTKPVVAAALLQLAAAGAIALDAPAAGVLDDGRLPGSLRQLLTHTSGLADYARLAAYRAAVERHPGSAWTDAELLERALAAGPDFPPGTGWAYSNTGYLLLRRVLDRHGGLASFLPGLGLGGAVVAETAADLAPALPAPSAALGNEAADVRGRYDPRWVGHRTLVASARDLHGFWRRLPAALADPAALVAVGLVLPGFLRPCYGLGVMADPGGRLGLVLGHGGNGPGYAAAAFAVPARAALAIVLSAREGFPAQATALALLERAAAAATP